MRLVAWQRPNLCGSPCRPMRGCRARLDLPAAAYIRSGRACLPARDPRSPHPAPGSTRRRRSGPSAPCRACLPRPHPFHRPLVPLRGPTAIAHDAAAIQMSLRQPPARRSRSGPPSAPWESRFVPRPVPPRRRRRRPPDPFARSGAPRHRRPDMPACAHAGPALGGGGR